MEEQCNESADIALKRLVSISNAFSPIEYKKDMTLGSKSESRSLKKINSLLDKIPDLDELFRIHDKVGEGTFSTVYRATIRNSSSDNKKQFAIKHLIPTSNPVRISQELRCLSNIGGKDNVVGLVRCLRKDDNVVFIMPYLPHEKFASYILKMDVREVKLYMKNLLLALQRVHSFNIIHRDVKPSNFLYDRPHKKFLLVDFGLAEEVGNKQPEPEQKLESNSNNSKKRKHQCIDESENDTVNDSSQHVRKRPALQQLTNTVNSVPVFKKPSTNDFKTLHSAVSSITNSHSVPSKSNLKRNEAVDVRHTNSDLLSPKRQPLSSNSVNVQNNVSPQKLIPRVNLFSDKNKITNENVINNTKNDGSVHKVSPKHEKDTGRVFQTLLPSKLMAKPNESSFLRVQNSQVKPVFTKPISPAISKTRCECDGKPQVCNLCIIRKRQVAPRAGTPGFRPPEVLLKYPQQTTAVDIWAAGVILLSLMSGCYPFFRSPDDITALAEIMTMFGTDRIRRLAVKFGKRLRSNFEKGGEDLRKVCERLRRRRMEALKLEEKEEVVKKCDICGMLDYPVDGCSCRQRDSETVEGMFPDSAYDLLSRLLDPDHDSRITAVDALDHPFLADCDS